MHNRFGGVVEFHFERRRAGSEFEDRFGANSSAALNCCRASRPGSGRAMHSRGPCALQGRPEQGERPQRIVRWLHALSLFGKGHREVAMRWAKVGIQANGLRELADALVNVRLV